MTTLRELGSRFRGLIHKRRRDADLNDEVAAHLDYLAEENVRRGMSPHDARDAARREFGAIEQIKEIYRERRGLPMLETFVQDLRFGYRTLRKNPGFTAVSIFTLALGIGATTLVFSIFYSALLKPMPFRDLEQLVEISETRLARGITVASFSEANFWDVRSKNHSFAEVAAYHYDEANMTGDGQPEKVRAVRVTTGFFRTLGVAPIHGRDFNYENEQQGAPPVAILGNRFWKNRFGGNLDILGKTVRLNSQAVTVVGILPPGEPWINDQFYLPFGYRPNPDRGSWEFSVVGRLAPNSTMVSAQTDLQRIAGVLDQSYPADDKGIGFIVFPSSSWRADDSTRRALWVLLGGVSFLLLIACLNIANLLLARGMTRHREIAVRRALGASRPRLVSLVLTESLMLSGIGAVFGLAIAYGGLITIQALQFTGVPGLLDASLNFTVLGFAAVIGITTGVLSGLAIALRAPRVDVSSALRAGDRLTGSRSHSRLRASLVAGEVALSTLLLIGAGLLVRSLTNLLNVNSGFQTQNRLVFSVSMPDSYYEKGVGKQFLDNLFTRLSAVPGVLAVGAVSHRPVEGGNPGMSVDSASPSQMGADHKAPWASWRVVTGGYFNAVGLPLLRGRVFDDSDKSVWSPPGQPVPARRVVISDSLARVIFPNEDAVGRHALLWKSQSNLDAEVVGGVGDSRERGLSSNPTLTVYLPSGINAPPGEIVVHTQGNPLAIVPSVRTIVADLDPALPIADIRPLEQVVERSVAPQRFNTELLAVFSGVALLLAAVGVYGVISYSVAQQTRELGVRMALGAQPHDVLSLVLTRGLRIAGLGLAIGIVASLAATRLMASLLYGVSAADPLTFASAAALLITVALAACWIPARRATRIDAVEALRHE